MTTTSHGQYVERRRPNLPKSGRNQTRDEEKRQSDTCCIGKQQATPSIKVKRGQGHFSEKRYANSEPLFYCYITSRSVLVVYHHWIPTSLTTAERVCEGAKAAERGKRAIKRTLPNLMVNYFFQTGAMIDVCLARSLARMMMSMSDWTSTVVDLFASWHIHHHHRLRRQSPTLVMLGETKAVKKMNDIITRHKSGLTMSAFPSDFKV